MAKLPTAAGTTPPSHRVQTPYWSGAEIAQQSNSGRGTLGPIVRIAGHDWGITNWHVLPKDPDKSSYNVLQPAYGRPIGTIHHTVEPIAGHKSTVDAALIRLQGAGHNHFWDQQMDYLRGRMGWLGKTPMVGFPHKHKQFEAYVNGSLDYHDEGLSFFRLDTPKGLTTVSLGDRVFKSGRTTFDTTGTVEAIDVATTVQYPSGLVDLYDQIVVGGFGKEKIVGPGDSGSMVLTVYGWKMAGLVFAGPKDGSYYLANKIQNVFEALFMPEDLDDYDLGV
jgi:hypothetical protein